MKKLFIWKVVVSKETRMGDQIVKTTDEIRLATEYQRIEDAVKAAAYYQSTAWQIRGVIQVVPDGEIWVPYSIGGVH